LTNLIQDRSRIDPARIIAKPGRDDQQYVVSTFSGLAADACSLSLQAGDELFEAVQHSSGRVYNRRRKIEIRLRQLKSSIYH
jgi:hypothetical protein